jgi:NAD(P)H-flavin reductase/Ca2+-binding EF-hand superfamily protein
LTSKPSGEEPTAPENDGDVKDAPTAPTARGAGDASPRRTVSGPALIASRIVSLEPRAEPAIPAPVIKHASAPYEPRITPAPITPVMPGPLPRLTPLPITPAEAPRITGMPTLAPGASPPLAADASPARPPLTSSPATSPLIDVRSAIATPLPTLLFTQPPLIRAMPEPASGPLSQAHSMLQAPPSSLPQTLSTLLVELLRCAVSEGSPEQQRRLRHGLERAIELQQRARAHALLLPAESAPPSLVPTPVPLHEPVSREPPSLNESVLLVLNRSFSSHAGPDSQLDVGGLASALHVRNSYLAERMLLAFDRDRDGVVNRAEFLLGVRKLVFGTTRDKLRFAFQIHDLNGDDALDRSEVLMMIRLSLLEEQALPDSRFDPAHLTELLFSAADQDGDGRLSFEDFEALVAKHPELMKTVTQSEARWIAPDADLLARRKEAGAWSRAARVLTNRFTTILLVSLWAAISAALFTEAAVRYHALTANPWLALARGAGAALYFNGALILLPVMRRMLTGLRRVPVLRALPLDDAIALHRGLGSTLFALSVVHAAAHLVNYARGPSGLLSPLASGAGLTGALLLAVFGAMWWFSRSAIRKSGAFELFYFTHLLYVPWLVLAFLHGPRFWHWAGVPLVAFLCEQLWRRLRTGLPAEVFDAEALVSGVTRLKIRPPQGFAHRAGDYLFLRLPALAPHEWHPFTISSAPERQNLTLHIRSLGNFTLALRQFVEDRQVRRDKSPLPAYIDGPYGTASGAIRESRYAVMIGAGIGVTPFTSVLESIVLRSQAGYTRPEKVHFFWLNRDSHSFEWFADLLFQIEALDERHCVDINIYMTDGRTNVTSVALNLAREVSHQLGHPDLVTGLRAQTHMGEPDWRAQLERIKALHAPEPVHVFFCGPPGLARKIRGLCEGIGLRFRQEHF